MAMGCLDDEEYTKYTGTGLYQQLGQPGVFVAQSRPNEKSLKLKGSRGTGSSGAGTITTSYPETSYATNFMAGASTGSTYTAGGGIGVTVTNSGLSNSYSLTDAVNMK